MHRGTSVHGQQRHVRGTLRSVEVALQRAQRPILRVALDEVALQASVEDPRVNIDGRLQSVVIFMSRDTQQGIAQLTDRLARLVAERRRRVENILTRASSLGPGVSGAEAPSVRSRGSSVVASARKDPPQGTLSLNCGAVVVAFFQQLTDRQCVRLQAQAFETRFTQAQETSRATLFQVCAHTVVCCVALLVVCVRSSMRAHIASCRSSSLIWWGWARARALGRRRCRSRT
jgi:hypothetical protein